VLLPNPTALPGLEPDIGTVNEELAAVLLIIRLADRVPFAAAYHTVRVTEAPGASVTGGPVTTVPEGSTRGTAAENWFESAPLTVTPLIVIEGSPVPPRLVKVSGVLTGWPIETVPKSMLDLDTPTRFVVLVGGDATDCGPVPLAFLAATLNVYVVPLVNPVTVCDVAVELNVRAGCATDPTYGVTT
jgi:hypothetical protein